MSGYPIKVVLATLAVVVGSAGTKTIREKPMHPVPGAPQVMRMIATPAVVRAGQKVVLTWNTRNTSRVLLEAAEEPNAAALPALLHSLGEFPANGTLEVRPKVTTTYVVSCGYDKDPTFKCAAASVRVVVK